MLPWVVIEQRDGHHAEVGVLEQLAYDKTARCASADDNRASKALVAESALPLGEQPDRQAR